MHHCVQKAGPTVCTLKLCGHVHVRTVHRAVMEIEKTPALKHWGYMMQSFTVFTFVSIVIVSQRNHCYIPTSIGPVEEMYTQKAPLSHLELLDLE